jgi:hypothetical protein
MTTLLGAMGSMELKLIATEPIVTIGPRVRQITGIRNSEWT